ncbi:hypothetical protein OH76DRAFT_1094349 [Lentinus brumalis]|uniref:Uncharacterized protein n=1 Tax=Lentinus brumalis TaxID=2498619 RepID=A0A371CW04_9APHY|nr:hypothetical protein OH76DRAFT_1094349 [Polyporus brumalis]
MTEHPVDAAQLRALLDVTSPTLERLGIAPAIYRHPCSHRRSATYRTPEVLAVTECAQLRGLNILIPKIARMHDLYSTMYCVAEDFLFRVLPPGVHAVRLLLPNVLPRQPSPSVAPSSEDLGWVDEAFVRSWSLLDALFEGQDPRKLFAFVMADDTCGVAEDEIAVMKGFFEYLFPGGDGPTGSAYIVSGLLRLTRRRPDMRPLPQYGEDATFFHEGVL